MSFPLRHLAHFLRIFEEVFVYRKEQYRGEGVDAKGVRKLVHRNKSLENMRAGGSSVRKPWSVHAWRLLPAGVSFVSPHSWDAELTGDFHS